MTLNCSSRRECCRTVAKSTGSWRWLCRVAVKAMRKLSHRWTPVLSRSLPWVCVAWGSSWNYLCMFVWGLSFSSGPSPLFNFNVNSSKTERRVAYISPFGYNVTGGWELRNKKTTQHMSQLVIWDGRVQMRSADCHRVFSSVDQVEGICHLLTGLCSNRRFSFWTLRWNKIEEEFTGRGFHASAMLFATTCIT